MAQRTCSEDGPGAKRQCLQVATAARHAPIREALRPGHAQIPLPPAQFMRIPFASEEGAAKGRDWPPEPTDVIITTYSKTGTTWLQQIAHQLRCCAALREAGVSLASGFEGAMEFDEITEVIPWIAFADDCDQDLRAKQVQRVGKRIVSLHPRLFKSHQRMAAVNRGCRYITTIRDPLATAVSYFNFYVARGVVSAETSFSDWVAKWAREGTWHGSPWAFYVDAFKCLSCPGVLLVCFELLRDHLAAHVRMIADFLGVSAFVQGADFETIEALASLEYMSAHDTQFDDHYISDRQKVTGRYGRCIMPSSTKVVASGAKRAVTAKAVDDDIRALLEEYWRAEVAPHTGFATYGAMREAIAEAWCLVAPS